MAEEPLMAGNNVLGIQRREKARFEGLEVYQTVIALEDASVFAKKGPDGQIVKNQPVSTIAQSLELSKLAAETADNLVFQHLVAGSARVELKV